MQFEEMKLSKDILDALTMMKFQEASPIQAQSIPHLLEGRDLVGQAQTGTGKTAAFGIPIIEKIDPNNRAPQALILCPTRELASQIAEELKRICKCKRGIFVVPLYGGQSIGLQFSALRKGANIIVATPGRMIDHLKRGSVKLNAIKMVVLDEVDEMLDIGFKQAIEEILSSVPKEGRQTVFFSATISPRIKELANKFLVDPVLVKATQEEVSSPNIEQFYLRVKESIKPGVLAEIINKHKLGLSLVFCNTKRQVDDLVEHLRMEGFFANGLHGDMRQSQRERVMDGFRKGKTQILVATDVAARGINVNKIEAVFNYDLPQSAEYYVHRIGRTGRAGHVGKAFTFVVGSQMHKLNFIQRFTKGQIVQENTALDTGFSRDDRRESSSRPRFAARSGAAY
ncbi:MAG: DEAD/DEAH box helicase [Candidatus Caenarcaniphilales bacterium]|nr:DEAD/DEAH box helicase [Candidatus Caenarcaniphilales bacterium]